MVKRADSHHRGCEFESSTCHNKNAIGEEGNGELPHKIYFRRKDQSPVFGFGHARNRVCDAVVGQAKGLLGRIAR